MISLRKIVRESLLEIRPRTWRRFEMQCWRFEDKYLAMRDAQEAMEPATGGSIDETSQPQDEIEPPAEAMMT
eukprot:m.126267 g.126267  ORF g.126267 m.126267 type:complete len:72 (-) comp15637_c0_seq4:221-436(-)